MRSCTRRGECGSTATCTISYSAIAWWRSVRAPARPHARTRTSDGPVCEWKVVWCHGTTCGRGNGCWRPAKSECTLSSGEVWGGTEASIDTQRRRDAETRLYANVRLISLFVCVCVSCVWLGEEQRHLESGVSQCDVRLWCFPTQRSGTVADGGVMSSSSVLLRCSHTSVATFFLPLCSSPAPLVSCVFLQCFRVHISLHLDLLCCSAVE